jgi:hypothetical protein
VFATDLSNDQIAWLIQRFGRDFEAIFIDPKRLCLIEINAVFFTIALALLWIVFKGHSIIIIPFLLKSGCELMKKQYSEPLG